MIEITTHHPASSYGLPVFANGKKVLETPEGVEAVREELGWSRQQFAEATGYKIRSVHEIFAGDMKISAAAMNVLRDALDAHRAKGKKNTEKTAKKR